MSGYTAVIPFSWGIFHKVHPIYCTERDSLTSNLPVYRYSRNTGSLPLTARLTLEVVMTSAALSVCKVCRFLGAARNIKAESIHCRKYSVECPCIVLAFLPTNIISSPCSWWNHWHTEKNLPTWSHMVLVILWHKRNKPPTTHHSNLGPRTKYRFSIPTSQIWVTLI
jgi:hypothetical protein